MIQAVIIDDEYKAREVIKEMLKLLGAEIEIIGDFSNIADGKKGIAELKPQIVFLDVDMKGGTGFDLVSQYETCPFDIIFVTAHDKYALPAIKASAFDFLVKPVSFEELEATIEKYVKNKGTRVQNIDAKSLEKQIRMLSDQLKTKSRSKKIAIPDRRGLHFVNLEDILRCEAGGNYTTIFLKDKKKMLVTKTLKEYEEILDPDVFLRVHQSHIVNKNEIETYIKNEGLYLKLSDGSTVDVSRRKKKLIDQALT